MIRFLPALAFLSGASGIAYEVLYAELLSSYAGDMFYVSAAILAIFFTGIGLGSSVSFARPQYLKYIEIFIGLYAVLLASLTSYFNLSITVFVTSLPIPETIALTLLVFSALALPAFAIGFSIPLFTLYIEKHGAAKQSFASVYGLYNAGAAISVVAAEYFLVYTFGISATIIFTGILNILIGLALFFVVAPSPGQIRSTSLSKRTAAALFAVSVLSGVLQMNTFSFFQHLIGPLTQNLALLISAMLISLTAATILVYSFYTITFRRVLAFAAVMSILPFALLESYIGIFSWMSNSFATTYGALVFVRAIFVTLFVVPTFVWFGATVPVLVKQFGISVSPRALSIAAFGNAAGYLLYVFVLFGFLTHLSTAAAVSALTLFIYVLYSLKEQGLLVRASALSGACLVATTLAFLLWPAYIYHIPYLKIPDKWERLIAADVVTGTDVFRKFGNDTEIVYHSDGTRKLFFNGYLSLSFGEDNATVLRELMLGLVPAYFGEQESALVLGLGSGISASSAAHAYDRVTIAEINPVMPEVAEKFKKENDGILERPNVSLEIQDGIVTLLSSTTTFDVIINNVASPAYFSAHKLWTKDFYDAANTRLNQGGIFAGWIDLRLGESGILIMERTLRSSFDDCIYVFLNSGYLNYLCSNTPFDFKALDESRTPPYLRTVLKERGWDGSVALFVRSIIFRNALVVPPSVSINTLDRPLLRYTRYVPANEVTRAHALLGKMTTLIEKDPITGLDKDSFCSAARVIDPSFNPEKCSGESPQASGN